jgi:hypothetical protein
MKELFSYRCALIKGGDVDGPGNLAKLVTGEWGRNTVRLIQYKASYLFDILAGVKR